MKKWMIRSLALILVLIASAAVYLYSQADSLIAKLKPVLESQVGTALNTQVALGEMNFQLFPNLSFAIDSTTLTDPSDSKKALSVGPTALQVSLLPLLSGNLQIHSVALEKISVKIAQTKDGIAIDGIPTQPAKPQTADKKTKNSTVSGNQSSKSEQKAKSSSGLPSWLAVDLQSFDLKESTVVFAPLEGQALTVEQINVSSGLAVQSQRATLTNTTASASLVSMGDVKFNSPQTSFHLVSQRGNLKEADLSVNLSLPNPEGKPLPVVLSANTTGVAFDLAQLGAEIATLAGDVQYAAQPKVDFALKKISYAGDSANILKTIIDTSHPLTGDIHAELDELSANIPQQRVSFKGLIVDVLSGKVKASGYLAAVAQSADLSLTYDNITYQQQPFSGKAKLKGDNGRFQLIESEHRLFGALLKANATAQPFASALPFTFDISTQQLPIGPMLKFATQKNDSPIQGTISTLTAQGGGQVAPDLMKSLSALSNVQVKDGKFTGGNLPAMVLKSLKDIPFLSDAIFKAVPQEYQSELSGNTTPIRNLVAETKLEAKTLNIKKVDLESSIFSMTSTGTVKLSGELNLETTFRFIPAFSLAIAERVKEAKSLLDENDRLVLPLKIVGTSTAPIIVPNVKEIMKLGAGKILEEKASELIGKAIGKGTNGKATVKGNIVKGLLGF